jgi:hypothetical protein
VRGIVEVLKLTQVTHETRFGLCMKILVWSQGSRNLFVLGYLERLCSHSSQAGN